MLKTTMISGVQSNTVELVKRRCDEKWVHEQFGQPDYSALGLCEGSVAEIVAASDVAEKASPVMTCEIRGNCPQHIVCLGIFGKVSDVEMAMAAVEHHFQAKG